MSGDQFYQGHPHYQGYPAYDRPMGNMPLQQYGAYQPAPDWQKMIELLERIAKALESK